jgi:hypothetical protein
MGAIMFNNIFIKFAICGAILFTSSGDLQAENEKKYQIAVMPCGASQTYDVVGEHLVAVGDELRLVHGSHKTSEVLWCCRRIIKNK